MTFTEAAAQVLRLVGKPLHYKEIADVAIEKNLLSHVGKSPEVTMGARLAALVKKAEKDNPLVRVKPGVFALREWDKKTIDAGLADRTPALQLIAENGGDPPEESAEDTEAGAAEAPSDPEAAEDEEAPPPLAAHVPVSEEDEEAPRPDAEEQARAEIAASATQLFEAEEDDDEPIFGDGGEEEDSDRGERESSSRRRRRRRRRRPTPEQKGGDDLPTYTVSDAPLDGAEAEAAKPARGRDNDRKDNGRKDNGRKDNDRKDNDRKDNDRGRREQVTLEGLAGEPLADALASLIAGYERNNGLPTLHKVAEVAHRRGRLSGDSQHTPALLAAVARADNLRRQSTGQRPRFRLSGNRIGLTDSLLDGDLQRAEKDVLAAVQRYRDVARRSLLTRLQQLPQKAVGELMLLLAERLGISGLSPVRRPGASGGELHLAGVLAGVKSDVRVALLIRRDGREVGREQVIDLRGALHHYGPAAAGWVITTGQVLSGAREEAAVPGAAPVTLVDGAGVVKLCEEHGVAVTETRLALPVPDGELFDALRSG
jgi:hypothetical protein